MVEMILVPTTKSFTLGAPVHLVPAPLLIRGSSVFAPPWIMMISMLKNSDHKDFESQHNIDHNHMLMTNLIFKAGRPGLEVSSVGLFDRFEADPVSHCNLFRHLVTVNVVAFHLSEDQRRHYSSYDQ